MSLASHPEHRCGPACQVVFDDGVPWLTAWPCSACHHPVTDEEIDERWAAAGERICGSCAAIGRLTKGGK